MKKASLVLLFAAVVAAGIGYTSHQQALFEGPEPLAPKVALFEGPEPLAPKA